MYIYQNGKLYAQINGKLVGVNISSHKTSILEGETAELETSAQYLTNLEVLAKFGINSGEDYNFPIPEKVVNNDDTVRKIKSNPRNSSRRK